MSTANVRNLLRNERKARRVEHPHATYNASGILSCQLCHIQIKAESLWNQHLRGSHHRGQLERHRAAQASKAVAVANAGTDPIEKATADTASDGPSSFESSEAAVPVDTSAGNKRKRRADDDGEDTKKDAADVDEDARPKKPRARLRSQVPLRSPTKSRVESPAEPLPASTAQSVDVDEDEWAAFTREVASPPPAPVKPTPAALVASAAVISAAPMTAAEIAARSREDESRQAREKKEAEMQDEQEDAADRIAEEMEEQEILVERVNKWKELRETLRQKLPADREQPPDVMEEDTADHVGAEKQSESSDEDDDDDLDGWGMFRN